MDDPIKTKTFNYEPNKKKDFWHGFLVGFFTNAFGFVNAFSVLNKQKRNGMIVGSVAAFILALALVPLAIFLIILIWRGAGPLPPG